MLSKARIPYLHDGHIIYLLITESVKFWREKNSARYNVSSFDNTSVITVWLHKLNKILNNKDHALTVQDQDLPNHLSSFIPQRE